MSRFRVLVSCPLIQDDVHEYDDLFAEHGIEYDVPEIDQQLDEPRLLEIIDRYDGVIAGDDEFTARVFAAADRLRVVSKWGVGVDNVDTEAAAEHGVTVTRTPGAFSDEVADVVIGYAIMLTRELHDIDRAVRNGEWICPRGVSLRGKTFGVVGVGDIGSAVVERAHAHGMEVLGHDVEPIPDDLRDRTGVEPVDLDELFARADLVSLNCALTEATRNMVGERELDALGPEGYLLNTARGELVDQAALVDALETGAVAGAALDVYAEEPLPADDPLAELDNVVLGTHNAQNTVEAVQDVHDRAVRNLIDGLTE